MEELIWKFIDNDCNDDELKEVNYLLENDLAFKSTYEDCLQLNSFLISQANKSITPQFKHKLAENIQKQLNVKVYRKVEIMTLPWIISLSAVAAASIIYALKVPDNGSMLFNFNFYLGDKTISLAIWSMLGLLCLLALDSLLNRMNLNKKQSFFMV